ncbi:DUF1570 domain-containing protein [Botrimarina hoheduenensis]|uniref:DUF1570 domain-containing protein n=1 Tax=Botrimarina hoheduenensis TaxID=2528000 RepID=A0A5C5W8Y2_9BACT|nr:DUF1570 domain-containing protein [Botrimarina hoheduenensis]TWT47348.1 hypothetical protein Pla111_09610 [Botrimarina hoheduenensis]
MTPPQRPLFAALLLALAGLLSGGFTAGLSWGQTPSDEDAESTATLDVAPARPPQGLEGLMVPEGVEPTPPEVPVVAYQPAPGIAPQIVRVLCDLGPLRVVVLPTGELKAVPREQTRPATEPLSVATDDEIRAWLEAGGLRDFQHERAGYFYFVYQSSDGFYQHTRGILESMLKGVVTQLRAWGLPVERPATPLVVIILPSRAAFDAYYKAPPEMLAYYNIDTNCVVMYEDERLFDAAPEYALKQASYVVAHEAIHQLLANTAIQQRRSGWPAWITEGIAEYFCPLQVSSRIRKADGDQIPARAVAWTQPGMVNDLRMRDLLRTPGEGGRVIREVVSAPGLTSHGYAVAWGLTHYLAEQRTDEFTAYLRELSVKEPLTPPPSAVQHGPDPLFVKHFGDDFAAIEQEVQAHLTSRKLQSAYTDPIDNQTHYVMSVTVKRGRVFYTLAEVAISPSAADRWARKVRERLKAEGASGHIVTKEYPDRRGAIRHLQRLKARLQ